MNGLDFTSQDAIRLTRNTVGYGALFIVLNAITGVTVALLLNAIKSRAAIKTYQTIMILPNFLSWVVVGFVSYILLNPSIGVFNQIITSLGFEGVDWYSDPKYWPYILSYAHIWKGVGMTAIMYYAALLGVDSSLYEAATIDGCNAMQTLIMVICPMLKPAMVSCALFQFMWSSNDYMGPLLYVKTPSNYPAAIFVRLSMDADTGFDWNRVLAVSLISIIPSLVVFFCAQKQFIEGISAGSVKG